MRAADELLPDAALRRAEPALAAAACAFAFLACCFQVQNFDVWWHLKTGQLTLQRGAPFRTDPYSFASGGARWVNSGWLAQVGMYLLFARWGFPALVLAKAAVIALAALALYASSRCRGASVSAFAVCLLAAVLAARFRFRVRPAVLSGLLCAVYVWLLDAHERTRTRAVWLLPPLMMLWANVHPGFPAGFVLLVLYFLSAAWRARRVRALLQPGPARTLLLVGLAAAAAGLVNPWGYLPFLYPLRLTAAKEFMRHIAEWGPPSFDRFYAAFWFDLAAGWLCVLLTWRRLTLSDALVLAVFSSMAVTATRHIFFFAFVSTPIFAKHLTLCARTLATRRPALNRPGAAAVGAALLLAAGAVKLAAFERVFPLGLGLRKGFVPAAAVDFIEHYRLPNNICNAYQWGGYLSWRCYPRRKIYIDGRCLVYGKKKFMEWLNAVKGKPGWRATFRRLNVNTLLLTHDLPLAIVRDPDWTPLYWDDLAVVLTRVEFVKAAALEPLARNARLTLPFLFESNWADAARRSDLILALNRHIRAQPDCAAARVLLARCLGRLGRLDDALAWLDQARRLAPDNTLVLADLGYWLNRAGRPRRAAAAYRELVRRSPRHAVGWYGLGVAYAALGDRRRAERCLRRAARLQPGFAAAERALDALRRGAEPAARPESSKR